MEKPLGALESHKVCAILLTNVRDNKIPTCIQIPKGEEPWQKLLLLQTKKVV